MSPSQSPRRLDVAPVASDGGAAVGVSGAGDSGYLSGNGLLAAVALGRIAGRGRA